MTKEESTELVAGIVVAGLAIAFSVCLIGLSIAFWVWLL